MIQFDLPKQKSSIMKVLGVGGGGSNAVNFMYAEDIEGTDFIICNTDSKALEQSPVPNKIQLGPHLTQGLGAGANPEVGKQATEESLEEIRRMLEVNTKMAFICAGMGGGTGTGGAPIIAQVCREMGILTVGIVTTPFGFEGPRRLMQAEHGIKKLQPYVDTLLVISNDKLRMQYGNLKMKEAFSKADNVLATAAKCITDIINSRGHIIVDFADVCTVMKNGGVAILGSASVAGENRAQRAIEEALNSPLLNDNDIKGAKWILININSAEGEHECTMDELEIINSYLRMQTGDTTDVIVGMGYDESLDDKIGITLIATGFQQKDPVAALHEVKVEKPKAEADKIVMTLGIEGEEKKMYNQQHLPFADKDPYAPILNEPEVAVQPQMKSSPVIYFQQPPVASEPSLVAVKQPEQKPKDEVSYSLHFKIDPVELPVQKADKPVTEEKIIMALQPEKKEDEKVPEPQDVKMVFMMQEPEIKKEEVPVFKYEEKPFVQQKPFNSFLSRPVNIYVDEPSTTSFEPVKPEKKQPEPVQEIKEKPEVKKPEIKTPEEETMQLELVIKETYEDDEPPTRSEILSSMHSDEEEEQKKRAEERLNRLRNLSFNVNETDGNNEYENVPAYVRRNMDLFGNSKLTSVEDFYSRYAVKKDNKNQAEISTLNTFLDGKKPD